MPFVTLNESPLIPGTSPVEIYYREFGNSQPLLFLHGGWGYEAYSFERQIQVFCDRFRILIPDRSGYGRSMRLNVFPPDFHQCAAVETIRFLDAINIEQALLWGHSDGAVIAAIMGLMAPSRILGIVLEAVHYNRAKIGSRSFFETMASYPEQFGERVCSTLEREHGRDYWRKLLENSGRAWLRIIEESYRPEKDLYGGRLSELSIPTLIIHGGRDPRTEPGELESVQRQLSQATAHILENAGHSPHSERIASDRSNLLANQFFLSIGQRRKI